MKLINFIAESNDTFGDEIKDTDGDINSRLRRLMRKKDSIVHAIDLAYSTFKMYNGNGLSAWNKTSTSSGNPYELIKPKTKHSTWGWGVDSEWYVDPSMPPQIKQKLKRTADRVQSLSDVAGKLQKQIAKIKKEAAKTTLKQMGDGVPTDQIPESKIPRVLYSYKKTTRYNPYFGYPDDRYAGHVSHFSWDTKNLYVLIELNRIFQQHGVPELKYVFASGRKRDPSNFSVISGNGTVVWDRSANRVYVGKRAVKTIRLLGASFSQLNEFFDKYKKEHGLI